ncbi:MAG: AAA family ATPase [Lachnospiraceae bacterium]|nr:AAA family ATPase [Lachnospiraceae bacterium]
MNRNYTEEQIARANETNLVAFMKSQGERLVKSGHEFRWQSHDSLTVRENKWYRHSQSKGGNPIDFVMEFYGKSFPEAVKMLTGEEGEGRQEAVPAPSPDFRLPERAKTNTRIKEYLTKERGIEPELIETFLRLGDVYEEKVHGNVIFVGRDEDGIPRYAHARGIKEKYRQDISGSDKKYGFCHRGEDDQLFVFEAPIDLLSFICLFPKDWIRRNYLSIGGVAGKALRQFLSGRPAITKVFLCLDNDEAGNTACSRLAEEISEEISVIRLLPVRKDWNEILMNKAAIKDGSYIKETVILRDEEKIPMIQLSKVEIKPVEWLWFPYIPSGKMTIIQGNPGEGKTFLAMMIVAACTNRKYLPNMQAREPCNVIYQTAEDGLADTIVPRLEMVGADLNHVLTIDDAGKALTLNDGRLEKAIRQNKAKLLILDPVQAFLGANVDMNRANEVRPIFRHLGEIAERTRCAIVLIGHLNKASGTQSTYRGLGSIDLTAVVRSLLFVGKVKKDPNTRVIVQEKSSLAPPGVSLAFTLDEETGFQWIGEYDITADELLAGVEGRCTEKKVETAEKLIYDMLADGKRVANNDMVKAAEKIGISDRTLRDAKRNIGARLQSEKEGNQWVFWLEDISSGKEKGKWQDFIDTPGCHFAG